MPLSRKESLADLLADLNSDRMALTEQRDALKAEVTRLREQLAEISGSGGADNPVGGHRSSLRAAPRDPAPVHEH